MMVDEELHVQLILDRRAPGRVKVFPVAGRPDVGSALHPSVVVRAALGALCRW